MMLAHIGQTEVANKVKNAWLATIEDGIHTADIFKEGWSKTRVSTDEFADAIVARLDSSPRKLKPSELTTGGGMISIKEYQRPVEKKTLVGVDVFIDWQGSDPKIIGDSLVQLGDNKMKLKMITNRGVKVYPRGQEYTYCTDHWRCRFVASEADTQVSPPIYKEISFERLLHLLSKLNEADFDIIKMENLYDFDGRRGFSLGQGE
jgi:isocitrate dehydrogenase